MTHPELENQLAFVNSQSQFHERMTLKFKAEPRRAAMHTATAKSFEALAKFIREIHDRPKTRLPSDGEFIRLALTRDDLKGLPDALIKQLQQTDSTKADFDAMEAIERLGGIASIDQILVQLYRMKEQINQRSTLNSRLYRLCEKKQLYSIPGKKGVYSLNPLSEEEASKLK